ncbi:MAG: mannose-1-phosphate guanylyltransferase [Pirellulaceae bacterium]
MLHAVIMAGGSGTRFWPASRAAQPKQLLTLYGDRSMIQATYDRIRGLVSPECTWVITNHALVDAIRAQLPELPPGTILGEPCKRDTAPCIGLSAGLIARSDPEATIVVLPADHVIRPTDKFQAAIARAVRIVQERPDQIVTFGIPPTFPAETYGYIERGEPLDGAGVSRVRMFREKPNVATAREFLAAGNFYWNSGIFVWKAATIWEAICQFEPDMGHHLQAIVEAAGTSAFPSVFSESFQKIQGKSIDYAVMEKHPHAAVVEADFEWDDVGSWRSIARLQGVDAQGNTVTGRHLAIQSRGCIVRTDDQHLVVTLGMEDCIIVHTPDATFVARKQDEETVRKVVDQLSRLGWNEYL